MVIGTQAVGRPFAPSDHVLACRHHHFSAPVGPDAMPNTIRAFKGRASTASRTFLVISIYTVSACHCNGTLPLKELRSSRSTRLKSVAAAEFTPPAGSRVRPTPPRTCLTQTFKLSAVAAHDSAVFVRRDDLGLSASSVRAIVAPSAAEDAKANVTAIRRNLLGG